MNITVLRDNLREGLGAMERAVAQENTLPILKNVLLVTEGNKIRVTATNLEIGITKYILGKIQKEGGITVPFQTLFTIVNNCDAEKIYLETQGGTLLFKTDNYEAKLQGAAKEDFPIIPTIEHKDTSITLDAGVLKGAILEIMSASQISDIRPEISGILFDFQLSLFKLVATDSFRLGEKILTHTQFTTNATKGFKVIIPFKTIQEIIRIFKDDRELTLFIDAHQILIEDSDTKLISRLVDGSYPDYEQIIPKTTETELSVPKQQFMNAVKLVSTFSGKVHDIKLRLKEGAKALEIYSATQQMGENKYLIPVNAKGSEFEELVFNWRYLIDGLKPIHAEHFSFGINGDAKPAVLRAGEDASYLYVVMPIKQ